MIEPPEPKPWDEIVDLPDDGLVRWDGYTQLSRHVRVYENIQYVEVESGQWVPLHEALAAFYAVNDADQHPD